MGTTNSQARMYFITICVQDRLCLFGDILVGEMKLNDAGKMVEKWFFELENKFPNIQCHEMVVMPNHFHCIIENMGSIGADLRVCPNTNPQIASLGEHIGSPLYRVMQWFKTMTTNEYIRGVKNLGWLPFDRKLWQRNYWVSIIRNEQSYQRIAQYIIHNPPKWHLDQLNRIQNRA